MLSKRKHDLGFERRLSSVSQEHLRLDLGVPGLVSELDVDSEMMQHFASQPCRAVTLRSLKLQPLDPSPEGELRQLVEAIAFQGRPVEAQGCRFSGPF